MSLLASVPQRRGVFAALRDKALALRDKLLSDPALMRRSGSLLATRMVARHEARALFDLAAGFVYAQTLFACVELKLFDRLAAGPATPAALAQEAPLGEAAMLRLLVAAEPLRLVERRSGGRWGLGRRGAAVLGNPGFVAMIRHHAVFYRELADPVALLARGRGAEMPAFWPYARAEERAGTGAVAGGGAGERARTSAVAGEVGGNGAETGPGDGAGEDATAGAALSEGAEKAVGAAGGPDAGRAAVEPYSALMAASQAFVAAEVLAAYPFARHRHLVDVGGGAGAFAEAALERFPALDVTVFDLPEVARLAATRLARWPRARTAGGNVFRDSLPSGDVVTLVRVLHDHDDAAAVAILRAVHQAVEPGGVVVVAEPMAGCRAAPGIAPYFAFYLAAMGSGRPRTAAEIAALLEAAGFARPRLRRDRNPTVTRVIVAHRR